MYSASFSPDEGFDIVKLLLPLFTSGYLGINFGILTFGNKETPVQMRTYVTLAFFFLDWRADRWFNLQVYFTYFLPT